MGVTQCTGADSVQTGRNFSYDGVDAQVLYGLLVSAGTIKETQEQIAALYGYDSYEDFIKNVGKTNTASDENNDGSTDGNGGPGKGFAVKFVRGKGEKVLDTQTNSLIRLWTSLSPREWTDPKTGMVYHVDADGRITRLRPVGNSGTLGFVSGAGGLKYVTYASKELQTLIATEKGAQSTQKINKFIEMMNKGDYSLFADPIYVYVYKGKQYILDGHHRIEAAIQSNKSIEVIILNTEKAVVNYKYKIQEIIKGLHN